MRRSAQTVKAAAVLASVLAVPLVYAQQAIRDLPVPESVSSDYDVPPKLLKQKKPKYPDDAFRKRIQGKVVVQFIIETTGEVHEARIIESVPGLDEAAVRTVRSWRFSPATLKGAPVRVFAEAPVAFCIDATCPVRKP